MSAALLYSHVMITCEKKCTRYAGMTRGLRSVLVPAAIPTHSVASRSPALTTRGGTLATPRNPDPSTLWPRSRVALPTHHQATVVPNGRATLSGTGGAFFRALLRAAIIIVADVCVLQVGGV